MMMRQRRFVNIRGFLRPLFCKIGQFAICLLLLLFAMGMNKVRAAISEHATEDQMKGAIKAYVSGRLLKAADQIDVRNISPMLSLDSLSDRVRVRQGAPDNRGLVGRSVFLIEIMSEDGREQQQWVSAEVSVMREIWRATRLIQRKETLSPAAFSPELFYQTRLEEHYLETAPWGKQASRMILPGDPLTQDRVQESPVIARGDLVTLVVEKDGVRITTKGRAKEEGFLGKTLAVVPAGSSKVIYGTVLDTGTVQVLF